MYEISLRGGPFDGRAIVREHCRIGLLLLVTGSSPRGIECELYRVRVRCGRRFAASVDRNATDPWQRALLPDIP